MINITKEQLIGIIEVCWGAASEAKIDCGSMNVRGMDGKNITDQLGIPILNQQRVTIFHNLVACLVPKNQLNIIQQQGDKEPWQE